MYLHHNVLQAIFDIVCWDNMTSHPFTLNRTDMLSYFHISTVLYVIDITSTTKSAAWVGYKVATEYNQAKTHYRVNTDLNLSTKTSHTQSSWSSLHAKLFQSSICHVHQQYTVLLNCALHWYLTPVSPWVPQWQCDNIPDLKDWGHCTATRGKTNQTE